MHRPFLQMPDPRLRRVATPVPEIDDRIRALWNEMLMAMYAMPGVGLAAPQFGEPLRLAVLDCSDGRNSPVRMANPELLDASEAMREHEEGSPNIPGHFARISRPAKVDVRYVDEQGATVDRRFEGLWSTSVQHQIDHLNGKLFIDHLTPMKRRMILAKHTKAVARSAKGKD
ncbi:peptide deformylase [Algicella marina]|uniref:Peptide deformylase-like n=1 Tax=Algicella marina TaxID=2683284 RepID=A0A6P1T2B2_9RHOB|nr:peptide deformylase [Algicella marina]QHQ37064.1 peptide deformylase [Algicella marina]